MNLLKLSILPLILISSLLAQGPIAERVWTSNKGSTIKAKVNQLEGDTVVFEKSNGQTFKVPLHMLIDADQLNIKNHFKQDPVINQVPNIKPVLPANNNPKIPQKVEDPKRDPTLKNKNPVQKDVNGSSIDIPYELGNKVTGIEVEPGLEANIYVPSTLRAGEKYATIILVEPRRGSHGKLNDFIDAAEQNEMIIASLPEVERRKFSNNKPNNWPKNKVYINEGVFLPYVKDTLRKLHKEFPIDTKRVYVAGFGETCHIALWAMKKLDAAGVLAVNGGGEGVYTASNREAILGICSPRSKHRWDLATTFKESKGSSLSYMMFSQGNDGTSPSDITEAILKLNGMFLMKHQKGTHEQPAERYEKILMETLDGIAGDGETLTPWIEFIENYGLIHDENKSKLEQWKKDIMKDSQAIKALTGYNDTVKTLLRYYGTGHLGYLNEDGKRSTEHSIKRLAKKYEGTIWESTLNELSQKSDYNKKTR